MELFDKSKFKTKAELFKHLVENKSQLIAMKKSAMKKADSIIVGPATIEKVIGKANKAAKADGNDSVQAIIVINTTKVLDSHDDVHFDGLWDKSLQENRNILHVQEHVMKFENIIADAENLKAFVREYSFMELGFDYEGTTQALVFDSKILKERNSFMHNQYKNGFVRNHSVGMQYIKLILCIDDEEYGAEKEAWDKYFPQILVGKERAEKQGYFWAVTEAKVIEGSAVPIGSNTLTPTLEVKTGKKSEPLRGTRKSEPQDSTLDLSKITKQFKY